VLERDAAGALEPEVHVGPRKREPAQHVGGERVFGGGSLQELAACGHAGEQLRDADARPGARGRGLARLDRAVRDHDACARRRGHRARNELHAAHRADARQGLAAKAERRDTRQVGERANLRRRVTCDREVELIARDAAAVVRDADARACRHLIVVADSHAPRARVERVLDELLEDRSRPLDDLARGDARDHGVFESADRISEG
jgi:hypothetical protein